MGGSRPMNPVAVGILPAVETGLPARRKWFGKIPNTLSNATVVSGGKMPALYGRQDARRYGSGAHGAKRIRGGFTLPLSPKEGNRQWPRREKPHAAKHSPALDAIFPLPGGEGQGEGERVFQLTCSG